MTEELESFIRTTVGALEREMRLAITSAHGTGVLRERHRCLKIVQDAFDRATTNGYGHAEIARAKALITGGH